MKDQRRLMTSLTIIVAVIALAAAVLAAARGSGCSVRLGAMPDPAAAVSEYLNSYRTGDFARMDELTYGYDSLGLSEPEDPVAAVLFDYSRSALDFSVAEEAAEKNMHAVCSVKLTFFDASLAKEDIRSLINDNIVAHINELNSKGEEFNSDSDEYFDMVIIPSVINSADAVLQQQNCLVKKELELELVYKDRQWQIVLSDELRSVLLGGLA